MTHYYTDNSNLDSNRESFEYYFDNEKFIFTTDNGVFSKRNVDYGSYLLLKSTCYLNLGEKVLDLGCGYGPIGIILKRFDTNRLITMVDVNSRAIELSKINCLTNNVNNEVYLEDNILNLNNNFDSIILNPPIRAGKRVIYDLYEKSLSKLNVNGSLYIVIQKKHGYESTRKKLESIFTEVEVLYKEKGYFILKAQK